MQLFLSPSVTTIQSEEEKSLTEDINNNSSLHLYRRKFPYTSNSKGLKEKKKYLHIWLCK